MTDSPPPPAIEFFVSPTGNDHGTGTAGDPFATLQTARDAARAFVGQAPVVNQLGAGTHYLAEPFVLGPDDSGSAEFPVVYQARQEGTAVLSGGQLLQLQWTPFRDGIFQAPTPAGLRFDQVFLDGKRLWAARYPNFDPDKPTAAYQGFAADAFSPERARVGLADNTTISIPVEETPADIAAARACCIRDNERILGAITCGGYSADYLRTHGKNRAVVGKDDFELISLPTDFLGINIYCGQFVRAAKNKPGYEVLPFPGGYPATTLRGWLKTTPQAMYWGTRFAAEIYNAKAIYVTENGYGAEETPNAKGEVLDLHRRDYLRPISPRASPRPWGRRSRQGLLRVVVHGQLRVGGWLQHPLRPLPHRLSNEKAHAETQCMVVQSRDGGKSDCLSDDGASLFWRSDPDSKDKTRVCLNIGPKPSTLS